MVGRGQDKENFPPFRAVLFWNSLSPPPSQRMRLDWHQAGVGVVSAEPNRNRTGWAYASCLTEDEIRFSTRQ
jgi:hypothetical protein